MPLLQVKASTCFRLHNSKLVAGKQRIVLIYTDSCCDNHAGLKCTLVEKVSLFHTFTDNFPQIITLHYNHSHI